MKNIIVKDVMVSLSEYATVPNGATLFEAVLALEKAQKEFDQTRYHHRAVLILDNDKRVIGKLTQIDVLRAIEPKSKKMDALKDITSYSFSQKFINRTREQYRLEGAPMMEGSLLRAMKLCVEDFMQSLSEGEYVDEDASLETAIHKLIMGKHLSLLVTRNKIIIGILRMSDVFAAASQVMKKSEISNI